MDKICVENLTRDYGGGRGVFGLSLSIQSGEVFGLLGPNGAGKTTLIRHLMGFIRPRSGRCRIDGLDCWTERHRVQAQVGYVPGEISFFEEMSGQQFLDFLERYRDAGPAARRRELIERFELDPKAPIARMSKGTKQKLAIVAAFMQDPELLVLDEPTSGLDPLMQNRFVELIQEEKRQGKTVFLSSHLFEEVERTCDRIGIIRQGELAAVDPVEQLRRRHLRSYTVRLDTEEAAEAFARDFSGVRTGCAVTLTAPLNLEEIFMHYYGGEAQ